MRKISAPNLGEAPRETSKMGSLLITKLLLRAAFAMSAHSSVLCSERAPFGEKVPRLRQGSLMALADENK